MLDCKKMLVISAYWKRPLAAGWFFEYRDIFQLPNHMGLVDLEKKINGNTK